jgi:hypothetical protein
MVDSDKPAFAAAIGAMLETFGQQATKPILHGYWLGMQDLPLEAVQRAVAVAITQSERTPRPVDLRRLAGEQTAEQRAIAAWGDVQRAVPRGAYKHIDFADRLVNATIRNLGGWPTFIARFSDEESEKWARHEFLKTYQSLSSSGVNGEACLPLPGLSERTAIGGVLQAPVPLRIECDTGRMKLPCKLLERRAETPLQRIEFQSVK